jgi:hypothetical protein
VISDPAAQQELEMDLAPLLPRNAAFHWREGISAVIDTVIEGNQDRPNQHQREIALLFGAQAWERYLAADDQERHKRRANLSRIVRQRMVEYDPGLDVPRGSHIEPLRIHCGDLLAGF